MKVKLSIIIIGLLMLTVCIDGKKITFKRRHNRQQIVTKVIFLKHADPYSLRTFISRALGPRSVVEAIVYNDGRKALIITTEAYQFSKTNGTPSLEDTIKELDKPGEIVPDHVFIYHPKARSARAVQLFLLQTFFDNRYDKDKVTIDPALNVVIVKAPKTREKRILEALAEYDIMVKSYVLHYTVYCCSKEELIAFNVNYSTWQEDHLKTYISEKGNMVFLNVKYKWCVAYLSFLEANNKMKRVVSGRFILQHNKWYKSIKEKGSMVSAKAYSTIQSNGAKVKFELNLENPKSRFKTSLFLQSKKQYILGSFTQNQKQDTSGWVEFSKYSKNMDYIIVLSLKDNTPASLRKGDKI